MSTTGPDDEYIVIFQQVITVPDASTPRGTNFVTTYHWADGQRYGTRQAAIDAGFTLRSSDDFNVGVVRGRELVWFGWMDEQLDDYDLDEIAQQIGLAYSRVGDAR